MIRKNIFNLINTHIHSLPVLLLSTLIYSTSMAQQQSINLQGEWSCMLDPNGIGEGKSWNESLPVNLAHTIILPGSLDTNGIGTPTEERSHKHLGKELHYEGAAWYSKHFLIPNSFEGKKAELMLERSKVTQVWINGQPIGSSNIIYAPQYFDATQAIKPGEANTITISVNNDPTLLMVDGSHALSPDTQTNWNGIIGTMALKAYNPLHIAALRVYPDTESGCLKLLTDLSQKQIPTGASLRARFHLQSDKEWSDYQYSELAANEGSPTLTIELGDAKAWSDDSPNLYTIELQLGTQDADDNWITLDSRSLTTGLRNFEATPEGFTINGHRTFLRGKHDACVFPLTGFPPTDMDDWMREFGIAKTYGINHYRFHTFTPPEAAFEAADRMGVYLQPELPIWWGFDSTNEEQVSYLINLGKHILDAYANHPSFVMFSLGNEITQDRAVLKRMVDELRAHDARPLFAQGSNNRLWDPSFPEGDDYWRSFRTGPYTKDGSTDARMSISYLDSEGEGGLLNSRYPSSTVNFDTALESSPGPFLGFEVGQYQVFPNFQEITRYDGVLKPYNLKIYKQRLADAGMLDQAQDFFLASGALSVLGYRADIEAMLRTERYAGFDLLDLQDYPGQGTALVGMLDAFMDNKGLIRPDQWREFCDETVILLEQPKFTWTTDENYHAAVSLSNFSKNAYESGTINWRLRDGRHVLKTGSVNIDSPAYSGLTRVADAISFSMTDLPSPMRLDLDLELDNSDVKTSYPLWVYSPSNTIEIPETVLVADSLTKDALARLNNGGAVLIFPKYEAIEAHSTPNQFISEFWNWEMFTGFAKQNNGHISAGTNGLLLDPYDPIVADFPTEFHTNYQWWPIVTYSRALILDDLPQDYLPKIQVIDSISRMHKLGLVCEFKVGDGKLLVCTSRLPDHLEYPEVRQFYRSLLNYANSEDFVPEQDISIERLKGMGL